MKKVLSLTLIAVVIIAITLYSCTKEAKENTNQAATTRFTRTLFGTQYPLVSYSKNLIEDNSLTKLKTTSGNEEYTTVTVEDMQMSATAFNSLIASIQGYLSGNLDNVTISTVRSITLYLTGANDYSTLKAANIFTTGANGYFDHKYYTINSSVSAENTAYRTTCNSYSLIDFRALLNEAIPPSVSANPTILVVTKQTSTQPYNSLIKKLGTTLIDANVAYKQNTPNPEKDPCQKEECGKGDGCVYNQDQVTGEIQKSCGGCKVIRLNDSALAQAPLDEGIAYSFRDVVLTASTIGQKYISYYYYISYISSQFARPKNLTFSDEYTFAVSCYNVANTLQYGNATDVPVSSSFNASAQSVITSYKTITANTYYQAVLTDISNDMNTYVNKTKAEILTAIQ